MKNRGRLVYTFCAFADLHIDCEGFYSKSAERWTQALRFAAEKNADFIVSAGDNVTNAYGSKEEWELFNSLIAQSDFHNPVWSANGNHDLRCGKERGTEAFMQATALDDVPYFYRTEPKSGDLFIFMAQESEYNSAASDQFSDAQILWLETLLDKYCGKVKVFLIEHSPIKGFGAGDRMEKPYYHALLDDRFKNVSRLRSILKKYKNLIFISGHTHEDFSMGYNFSNENGGACNMIHVPALAGSTLPNPTDNGLDYNGGEGFCSQGYFVEVFENAVIFHGAEIPDGRLCPEYEYIISTV